MWTSTSFFLLHPCTHETKLRKAIRKPIIGNFTKQLVYDILSVWITKFSMIYLDFFYHCPVRNYDFSPYFLDSRSLPFALPSFFKIEFWFNIHVFPWKNHSMLHIVFVHAQYITSKSIILFGNTSRWHQNRYYYDQLIKGT